jgi:hypothetical protein
MVFNDLTTWKVLRDFSEIRPERERIGTVECLPHKKFHIDFLTLAAQVDLG